MEIENTMSSLPPILVADLFPKISRHLLELLRSLRLDEWNLPTLSSRRSVKDIASHLLDGSFRRLSIQRDGYRPPDGQLRPGEPLTSLLNRLNDEWEIGTRRLSPRVLIELLEGADCELAQLFQTLDPFGPALFPVAWLGEEESCHWTDMAREYTEKWHHTQQIFDATGRTSTILTKELGHPCLDIFMRALPFTYRDVDAPEGTVVEVRVSGDAGGSWFIERRADRWLQMIYSVQSPAAIVEMDQDTAWRMLTKRRARETIRRQFPEIRISGDEELGAHALDMVSVMA